MKNKIKRRMLYPVLAVLCLTQLILTFSTASLASAPKITSVADDAKWRELLVAAGSENWSQALALANLFIPDASKGNLPGGSKDSLRAAKARYIKILAASGLRTSAKLTYEELKKITSEVVGNEIISPARTVLKPCRPGDLNFICLGKNSKELFISASNKTGTSILAFEHVSLASPLALKDVSDGMRGMIFGTVSSIEVRKSLAIVMDVYIVTAKLDLDQG